MSVACECKRSVNATFGSHEEVTYDPTDCLIHGYPQPEVPTDSVDDPATPTGEA